MKYIEKLNAEELYQQINIKISNGGWTADFLSIVNSYMSKYKDNPESLIKEIMTFISDSVDDIRDELKNTDDKEYLTMAEYPDDLIHIQKDFANYGFIISVIEAEILWEIRSDNWAAQWIYIGEDEDTFIEFVLHCLACPY